MCNVAKQTIFLPYLPRRDKIVCVCEGGDTIVLPTCLVGTK